MAPGMTSVGHLRGWKIASGAPLVARTSDQSRTTPFSPTRLMLRADRNQQLVAVVLRVGVGAFPIPLFAIGQAQSHRHAIDAVGDGRLAGGCRVAVFDDGPVE